MLVSAASVEVYGEAVLDPAALLEEVDNELIVLGGSFVFVVATIGVNIVANFVSAAFDLSNLNPRRISFKTGGIIASFAALLSTPWNLYNSPEVIAYFLGALGALLGPFFGIMAVDYFVLRKGAVQHPRPLRAVRDGRSTTTTTASTGSRSWRSSPRRSSRSRWPWCPPSRDRRPVRLVHRRGARRGGLLRRGQGEAADLAVRAVLTQRAGRVID